MAAAFLPFLRGHSVTVSPTSRLLAYGNLLFHLLPPARGRNGFAGISEPITAARPRGILTRFR